MHVINLNIFNINTWVDCLRVYCDDTNELLLTTKKFERMYNNDDDFLIYLLYTNMCYLQDIGNDSSNALIRCTFKFMDDDFYKKFNKKYSLKTLKILKKYTPNYYRFLKGKNTIIDNILAMLSNFILENHETTLLSLLNNTKYNEAKDMFEKDYENFLKNYFMKKIPILNELRHYFKTVYLQTFLEKFKKIGCLLFDNIKNIELYSIDNINKLNYIPIDSLFYLPEIYNDIEYIKKYMTPEFLNNALILSCITQNMKENIPLIIMPYCNNTYNLTRNYHNTLLSLYERIFSYINPPYKYLNLLRRTIFLNVLYKDNTRQLILNLKDKFKVYNINDKFNIKNSRDLYLTTFAREKPDNVIPNEKINYTDIIFDGNMNNFLIEFIYFYKEEYNNRYKSIDIENINKILTIDVENNKFIFDDENQFLDLIKKIR